MSRSGATEWSAGARASVDSPELHHADHVVGELARGHTISATDRVRAEATLVDLLWRGGSGDVQRAQQGLEVLSAEASPEDRMRLLGEMVAAGKRALPVFDKIVAVEKLPLSREETAQLRGLTEKGSVEARLREVAKLLGPEGQDEKSPGGELPVYVDDRMILARRIGALQAKARQPKDGDGGRPDADRKDQQDRGGREDLLGPDLPPGRRIQLAHDRGRQALPELLASLGGPQGEMVTMILLSLARAPELRRSVLDGVERLEANKPEVRGRAELIANKIRQDAHGLPGDDSGARARVREAGLGTNLLERALELCDTPSLLLAAAGREVLALPMAMARLAARRGVPQTEAR